MILHIDMDAFYASVEQLDDPLLRGRPVIVGGSSDRGVVSAASYEARSYGIHSAMPVFQARRRCPEGIFRPPRMKRYRQLSRRIMALLHEYTPLVEGVSIDEAYLDIRGCGRLHGEPSQVARSIKDGVRRRFGLTCSIGIAPVKFLAKIASDLEKPDGLTLIAAGEVGAFLETLPVEKVPGIGRVTRRTLAALGVRTLADVRRLPEPLLKTRLGRGGLRLRELAAGRDPSAVVPVSAAKSISTERTLAADTRDRSRLRRLLLDQAGEVARQLRAAGMRARTVTLKVKHSDFRQATRSTTLPAPVCTTAAIHRAAVCLLDAYPLAARLRLIGVGVSGLLTGDCPVQRSLFEAPGSACDAWERVDCALDAIHDRYGRRAVRRAALADPGGDRAAGPGGGLNLEKDPESV